MELSCFGYLGVASGKVEQWREFATRMLGLQSGESVAGSAAFRVDDHRQRLFIDPSLPGGRYCFGWQVDGPASLAALAARLEKHQVDTKSEPSSLAERRGVREVLSFNDPAGNRLEAFHTPLLGDTAFVPSRALSGFRTGALGLGHIVLTVSDMERARRFYEDVLGFRLSDHMAHPFKAVFYHLNARHHSLALIDTGSDGVHHLMLELLSLDDVGQSLDLLSSDPASIGVSMGRHTNDLMTSFYMRTPSDFMIEYGWGGLEIDMNSWTPKELVQGPSLWGHDRYWLPPERQAEARAMRLQAAAEGARAPVQVIDGLYHVKRR